MTDDDFKYLNERNAGFSCPDPFKSMDSFDDDTEEEIEYLDIPTDDDDRVPIDTINIDHLFDEE